MMKKYLMLTIASLVLAACSSSPEPDSTATMTQATQSTYDESGGVQVIHYNKTPAGIANADMQFQSGSALMQQQFARGVQNNSHVPMKTVNHYVRSLMNDLINNMHYVDRKTPLGVSSFVFLDTDLNKTNLLGKQIAESFMHEIHQTGIPVIDFKATNYIRVTESGDFSFSRDYMELKEVLPLKYVLSGTLVKHQDGILVNARIIGLQSKAIVASAQGFLPENIVKALLSSEETDGIQLVQGM